MLFAESTIEETLLEMPALPTLYERIGVRLAEEQKRRAEFREWLTPDMKAEFINGATVLHSPAAESHNEAVLHLGSTANLFATVSQSGKVRVEKALVGMTRNDYEPDIAFWRKEIADTFTPEMNVYPLPDLVIEVLSPGNQNIKRDRETKFTDYADHGIPEYWIVDPIKQTVEQYFLSETEPGEYELSKKVGVADHIESKVLRGFALPVRAIFEAKANAEAVRRILENAGGEKK